MTDDQRNGRVQRSKKLREQIGALEKVESQHRAVFLHDRLMDAIDDICAAEKPGERTAFTIKQVDILKDVAFQIVFLLDPANQPPKSRWGRLRQSWRSLEPGDKWTIGVAILTLFAGCLYSLTPSVTDIISFFRDTKPLP